MDLNFAKVWLRENWMLVLAGLAVLFVLAALCGCGPSDAQKYAEKLKTAGFGTVQVEADRENKTTRVYNSTKKKWENKTEKKTVAYDVEWRYDNPATDGYCMVEVEHPYAAGRLSASGWHVDEVVDNSGRVVEVEGKGWGAGSPTAAQVREQVTGHNINC